MSGRRTGIAQLLGPLYRIVNPNPAESRISQSFDSEDLEFHPKDFSRSPGVLNSKVDEIQESMRSKSRSEIAFFGKYYAAGCYA